MSRGSALRLAARAAALLGAMLFAGGSARAQPLVADLSRHLIAIGSGFTGTEVLLYGAIEGDGDVVVVVRGPDERVVVRRKERIAGIWVNRKNVVFDRVPSFFAIAASRPLDRVAPEPLRKLHQLGIETLDFVAESALPPDEIAAFRKALLRNKVRDGFYAAKPGKVGFVGSRLFRTRILFPANVPTGTYSAQVFLIRDGEVISAESTPLFISKIGFQADVNFLAHNQPAIYGVIAIAIALVAGWGAAAAFRKA